jgi:hypothetical protein
MPKGFCHMSAFKSIYWHIWYSLIISKFDFFFYIEKRIWSTLWIIYITFF